MDTDNIPKSEADLLHQVFDQSTEGFQVIDKNWKYVFVNKTVAEQGRTTAGGLIGKTMMEAYPGIEKTELFKQMERCMNEKVGIRMENEFIYPGGEKGWFQLFMHPWSNGIMIFSVDITGRKNAEQEMFGLISNLEQGSISDENKKKVKELKAVLEKLNKPSVTLIE